MAYSHLTEDERNHIYELKVEGLSVRSIAKTIGRDKSTISREIRRNCGLRGYRPRQAHQLCQQRAKACANGPRVAPAVWEQAKVHLLQDQWSPEQISGRLERDGTGRISHETIYQRIYEDKAAGGRLHRALRCQKARRKRYGSGRSGRGQISGRIGIEHRPEAVENRARVGDWEADTVVGRGHAQAIVTLVERKTRYTALHKVARNTSALVSAGILVQLAAVQAMVKTITFDNGREFAAHASIGAALGASMFFANPYCSWERGLNENTNGLIRQYFRKGSCFLKVRQADLDRVAKKLNNRPRKCLDYETPREAFMRSAKRHGVALRI